MTVISFRATCTTTVAIPSWAPPIYDASTGTGAANLTIYFATTTTQHDDDHYLIEICDLVSYDESSFRLRDDIQTTRPYVTLRYTTINELVRT